ncbi:MAG: hypothetical protein HKN12_01965, partial [Gemmatimonadetes bacterium]|nr:hypothetical protein [Gemmatimonadota bacterium]
MIAALRRRIAPALILFLGLTARVDAQCVSDSWTLEAATGDVAEIETAGNVAWIAANGGVIRIDLSTLGQERPSQVKITDSQGLISSEVSSMTIDGFGNVYVGTRESGISVFNAEGQHLRDLTSFDEFVWGDRVVAIQAVGSTTGSYTVNLPEGTRTIVGDRVVVSSADSFSAAGTLEGGGMKAFYVERLNDGTFRFTPEPGLGIQVELVRELFLEPGVIWAGTSGLGVWKRDETVVPPTVAQVLSSGLRSGTVKEILRGPQLDGSPGSVLWIGTGDGLQTWDEASTLTEFSFFNGHNILDLHLEADDLYVLSE